jgi:hypothetical protein
MSSAPGGSLRRERSLTDQPPGCIGTSEKCAFDGAPTGTCAVRNRSAPSSSARAVDAFRIQIAVAVRGQVWIVLILLFDLTREAPVNPRKILIALAVLIGVFFLVTRPIDSANAVRDAFDSIIRFLKALA